MLFDATGGQGGYSMGGMRRMGGGGQAQEAQRDNDVSEPFVG